MKNKIRFILTTLLSLTIVLLLFIQFDFYTPLDVPTKNVIIRYIVVSLVGNIILWIVEQFYLKNKTDKIFLLSGLSILPFILHFTIVLLINILPNNLALYNLAAMGLLLIFILKIITIPYIILSIICIIKSQNLKTRILSIIDTLLWCAVLVFIIFISI